MNLLQKFVIFLLEQRPKRSLLTVKNYKADIGQFLKWFEKEFKSVFSGQNVTSQIIDQYRKSRNLSPASAERHLSSLRKFLNFLQLNGNISYNPLERETASAKSRPLEDPWMLRNFKSFLYEDKKSNLTTKNYINDVKSFYKWLREVTLVKYSWNVADKNLLHKINSSVAEEYKQRLITAKFSPATINRKLSSLRNYISWANNQGLISENSEYSENQNVKFSDNQTVRPPDSLSVPSVLKYSSFPPKRLIQKSLNAVNSLFDNIFISPLAQTIEATQYLFWKATGKKIFKKGVIPNKVNDPVQNIRKEFYAPLNISTRYLPTHKRIWHYLRHVRPNWYKQYHSYSFTHYFHFAILMILSCAIGFGIYNNFFTNTQKENAVLGTATNVPPRILSFQGKLTDPFETPITKETSVLFSLYNDDAASFETALWQEENVIKPNSDGSFSISLGKKTAIPDAAFSQNSRLFLGIAVENSIELKPRQEIATTAFANSAKTLQGLEPITGTDKVNNVILALDSSGNLSIAGSKTHAFQAIGGNLILSGKVLSLVTAPGSGSNVEIAPDGLGKIDLQKPIQNSSNDNNLSGILGAVEFDDVVAILATSSAQSAFAINQNSTGIIISANTNGIAKFTVANDGTGFFAGDLGINGGNLTSSATTFNFLNSAVTTLNIGGAATAINLGASGGNTTIRSNLILSSLTSNGGILYTNGSGKISQTSAGSSSDCLTGGTSPSFIPCSKILNLAGSVGIGTTDPLLKLDVQDDQSSTAAAQIYNTSVSADADGLIIKLGNVSASLSASNHFINFETAGIGVVGSVQGEGASVAYKSGNADFAEYFKKNQNISIPFGAIACLDNNSLVVACDRDNKNIIGVASEHPAFLGGNNLGNDSIAVGLVGQIETLASIANGEIRTGDALTASDIPGVAVKTIKTGQIIGKALEDLAIIDESKVVGYYDPDNKEYRSKTNFPDIPLKANIVRIVKLPVSVNVSWHDPSAFLAQNGDLIINSAGSNEYSIANSRNEILANIEGFMEVVAAKIKAGLINASEVITNTLVVTSDSVIVNGQNLKDYIASVIDELRIKNQESSIISPVIRTDQIATSIISPLGESLIVKLATPSAEIHNSSFIIQNSSGSAIASIDSAGKINANEISVNQASISGNLNASDASVSGTLRAKNIIADSITGLDARISNIYSTNFANLASYSAQLSYVPDLVAERAQFNQGLMVFGGTSLADLSIAGRLSIGGTMFITENSIETLGADLSLQSLRQGGLSIMGGLIYIDTEGNIKIQGDLSISGKLAVSGDIITSGSGTFTKLNFSLIQPVLAVSSTEVIASSSAGVANISPYQSEITIKNILVTDKSVIYITPVGTPSAQTPFLMRQTPQGSFTVGVQSPTNHPLDFNWLIIN